MTTPRARILDAAARLLAEGGRDAVSTRAVSAAAGVQAQTIYRQFGDMAGLFAAVADEAWARYLGQKKAGEHRADPVADLVAGWDLHVEFGLTNPALYKLIYGDPRPGDPSAVSGEGFDLLTGILRRVAAAGRLRLPVEAAAPMVYAASVGATLALIAAQSDGTLDAHAGLSRNLRDAVMAAVLTEAAAGGVASRALALKAALPAVADRFSAAEEVLLTEWLDRIAAAPRPT
ncbi:helix-turn-helix domain containing protein [Asanoa sp. WMMD1127]|uniref:TetR/AcrR family transcriptional regulator n=1 Tax=Asanoa sp. WMMD1127 TaxID=3016107 RepID=UPI0024170123|nr:TetR/AcrR family transcriptional regulator [Asanoa sp. WMMD1127]MDG4825751.1 helix-turn-helix domain containing protein [Asanoa sp. WMMD1127]